MGWEGHEIGLAFPGVVPLATAKGHHELHSTCREASNVHGPEAVWWLDARNRGLRAGATSGQRLIIPQSDFGDPFVASHVLTRTKFANCARLRSLLAVSGRIRFLPRSPFKPQSMPKHVCWLKYDKGISALSLSRSLQQTKDCRLQRNRYGTQ